MKTPIKSIHIPHSLNLTRKQQVEETRNTFKFTRQDERKFEPTQLGDVYSEGSESMDDFGPLPAFMMLAAIAIMAASIAYYLTK
jgi:hypothetical protein